ncbi:MAG TPA: PadR family transcriptional regulator [Mycobacteriales bacterium]|nr:PadR family transcriptional regulator [Mycobacteriales bacterium]
MPSRTEDLGATRFAILGQLALRDWSSYELAQSMRRTVRFFWPRAESVIYAEAKRLEADGYAASRTEPAADGSRRTRTVYSITKEGRRALARWLATTPSPPQMYSEPLLRVHLSRFGSLSDLSQAIDVADAAARDILQVAEAVAREYVAGTHLFQEEAHIRGLLFDGLVAQAQSLQQWASAARSEVARWPDIRGDDKATRRAIGRMRAFLGGRDA